MKASGRGFLGRAVISAGLVLAFFLVSAMAFSGRPVTANSEIETKMQELNELNDTLARYEKQFNEKKKQANQVLNQLGDLEDNMTGLEKDVKELQAQIAQIQTEIEALQQDIEQATEHLNQRVNYLDERLVQIYQQGDVSYLEVVCQATSFTDFLTRFDLIERIAEKDMALLQEIQEERALLVEQKAQLESKSQKLVSIKDQTQSKHAQLELQSQQKQTLLKSIEEEQAAYSKAMDELEESQKDLEALIRELQSKNNAAYMDSGAMTWPVPGYSKISSPYGWRNHPIFKERRFHAGIDIPAPKGTMAVAAARGSVIFAGTKSGYGNCIIVDHGGGVSTQYSHLSKISVNVGAVVDKGAKVGEVGSTGWSTGNHLDFVVRINGETVDPLNHPVYSVKP